MLLPESVSVSSYCSAHSRDAYRDIWSSASLAFCGAAPTERIQPAMTFPVYSMESVRIARMLDGVQLTLRPGTSVKQEHLRVPVYPIEPRRLRLCPNASACQRRSWTALRRTSAQEQRKSSFSPVWDECTRRLMQTCRQTRSDLGDGTTMTETSQHHVDDQRELQIF